MAVMSDLHVLSERVLQGESVSSVASDSAYSEEDISWATSERLGHRR